MLTIAGVTKQLRQGFTITDPANGQGMMQFDVVSADGSYVPSHDDEVILTEDGVRIFGGTVTGVREHGAGGFGITPIESEISASDFNMLASRRYFGESIPAGTLKAALTQLLPYLAGVTLHAGQVDGPSLPAVSYTAWKIKDILDQFATFATGYVWKIDYTKVLRMYTPGSVSAPFNIAAGDGNVIGDVVSEQTRTAYANRILVYGTGVFALVEDAGEETAHGVWELVVRAPDITTQVAADALGAAVLAVSLAASVKRVTYHTYGAGVASGQAQGINLPKRHLNNTFLLQEVKSIDDGANRVRRTVSVIEGSVYQPGWREQIQAWGGVGGGMTTAGVGGCIAFVRFAYPMGGSKLEPVRGTGTSWEFVGEEVEINTVPRGTTAATVYLGLSVRDAGMSVKARLFDRTGSAACPGESAAVTSLTPEFVSFGTTLTAGTRRYKLQVQPSIADRDVIAEGIHAI